MRNVTLLTIILVLAGVVLYLPAINAEFILDGHYVVKHNPVIKQPLKLSGILGSDFFGAFDSSYSAKLHYFRPVVLLSYALNYWLTGTAPWAFRLTNILAHFLSAWLIFLITGKLFTDKKLGILSAILFFLLPVNEWCVNYISGRADVLQALFSLLSLYCLLNYVTSRRPGWWELSIMGFLLAILSREVAILWPAFLFFSVLIGTKDLKKSLVLTLPFAAISIIYFFFRSRYFPILSGEPQSPFSLAILRDWFYLTLDYNARFILPWSVTYAIAPLARIFIFLSVLVLLVSRLKSPYKPAILFGLGWMLFGSLPFFVTHHMFARLGPYLSEHFLYLSGFGFAVAAGAFLSSLPVKTSRALSVTVIALMTAVTFRNNTFWTTEEALLKNVRQKEPGHHVAYEQLLMKYENDIPAVVAMIDSKSKAAEKSLWLKRLGLLYRQEGNYAQAKETLTKALALDPHNASAGNALGICFLETGDFTNGIYWLKETVKTNPQNTDANRLLGEVYFSQNDCVQALPYFERALELDPDLANVQNFLSRCVPKRDSPF